jgi:hypothetical protein
MFFFSSISRDRLISNRTLIGSYNSSNTYVCINRIRWNVLDKWLYNFNINYHRISNEFWFGDIICNNQQCRYTSSSCKHSYIHSHTLHIQYTHTHTHTHTGISKANAYNNILLYRPCLRLYHAVGKKIHQRVSYPSVWTRNDSAVEYQTILISHDILTLLTTTLGGNRFVPTRRVRTRIGIPTRKSTVWCAFKYPLKISVLNSTAHLPCRLFLPTNSCYPAGGR